ncbi:MAG: PIN domain-containing protein [Rickettsia endosymbiont of Ixodes persulcatus]|nr:PIN domain-containing protein [Rickettsia endosymbiont of Ixodes persulcatus]MCZ6903840.1 PIN domain-containing protein [Rickettsia endosymbiont of Ixodes persulcatus]MCZ6909299.1 PIN domain-containing protein [Rickettsia endosymbiont of Ixodes persulcatus]MCZ6910976.1 PIN domain-containing protein [Rickettsia endosymbiont of Ixodes persulcatus]MCZ6913530.1 PIN domain-containing protein [Rickettsia endosymbiont of Ixodes persulcatus]
MGLIIDISIFIALERGKITTKAWSNYDKAFISPITLTELLMGIDRADNDNRRIKRLDFIEYVKSLFTIFGIEEAYTYARIIHNLYKANITIGTHDLLIAATAITNNFPILTLNVKDFKRIHGLKVLTVSSKD